MNVSKNPLKPCFHPLIIYLAVADRTDEEKRIQAIRLFLSPFPRTPLSSYLPTSHLLTHLNHINNTRKVLNQFRQNTV